MAEIPTHIVIIPDGNRRWSAARHLPQLAGHRIGIDKLRAVLDWCREFGVRSITFWGFSYDNFKRDPKEVEGLMRLFERKFDELKDKSDIHRNKIRVRFFGRLGLMTERLQKKIKEVEEETKGYGEYNLSFLLAYGGKGELVDAVNAAIADAKAGKIEEVDEGALGKYMYMSELPEPDLIIRTSGEQRLSGVLPWTSGYSELYFCPKLWPDFGKGDFKAALDEYAHRKRRFGK